MNSDGEIARAARLKPIVEIGAKLGIPADALIPYGHTKAKISAGFLKSLADLPDEDWQHMLCVEAARIREPVILAPGSDWAGLQSLRA